MIHGVSINDWNACKGDKTLRVDYPLNENSFVMDVGSFKGEWSQVIYDKYKCTVWSFEPVEKFFLKIIEKFKDEKGKIKIFKFALGKFDERRKISVGGDGSSFYKNKEEIYEEVSTVSISKFIKDNNIKKIDLIKLNVEGSEYDILEDIIEKGLHNIIENIQVQFHSNGDNYKERMENIRNILSKTHRLTYYFPMIWENWSKMKIIDVRDSNFFSGSYPTRQNPFFQWRWNRQLRDNDVTVFSDCHLKEVENNNSGLKIAWLIEPPAINKFIYDYVRENYHLFDYILTFDESLLSINNKFKFYYCSPTWVHEGTRAVHEKNKMVSAIFSSKRLTPAHTLRHDIVNMHRSRIDVMGRGYHAIDQKIDGLKDYRYHITIENSKLNTYFTEKITDCFMTGTVPIYWGCPKITQIFNSDGIIVFDKIEEIEGILNSLSEEDYNRRLPAIMDNFEKVQKFVHIEKSMWENLFMNV